MFIMVNRKLQMGLIVSMKHIMTTRYDIVHDKGYDVILSPVLFEKRKTAIKTGLVRHSRVCDWKKAYVSESIDHRILKPKLWSLCKVSVSKLLLSFLLVAQVVPGPVQPYIAESWPKTPIISFLFVWPIRIIKKVCVCSSS